MSNFSANLPDPLRIKPTGLQQHQIGVYEDFGEYLHGIILPFFLIKLLGTDPKRRITSRPSSTMSFTTPALYSPSPAPEATGFHTHQEAMDRFTVCRSPFSQANFATYVTPT